MEITVDIKAPEVAKAFREALRAIERADSDAQDACWANKGSGGGGRSGKPSSSPPPGDRRMTQVQRLQTRALWRIVDVYLVADNERRSERDVKVAREMRTVMRNIAEGVEG